MIKTMKETMQYMKELRFGEVRKKRYGQLSTKQKKAVKKRYKSGEFTGTQAEMTSTKRFSRLISWSTGVERYIWHQLP